MAGSKPSMSNRRLLAQSLTKMQCKRGLRRYTAETKRNVSRVSDKTARLLIGYDWPGNIRELENTIERAVVLGADDEIVPDDLPAHILDHGVTEIGEDGSFHSQVRGLKAELIRDALRKAGGRHRKAAESLGLNPTYLSRLIRNLGIKE